MKTVAIDTSLPSGSVAALDGERMSEVCFAPAQAHARRIAAALAEATAVAFCQPQAVPWQPGAPTLSQAESFRHLRLLKQADLAGRHPWNREGFETRPPTPGQPNPARISPGSSRHSPL